MIKNERQYRITKTQAEGFSQALASLEEAPPSPELHPLLAQAQKDALRSQMADLTREMQEYESLKAGEFQTEELKAVARIPATLIKARIARGLTQKDLAKRVGLKEQQIQRYEATGYASASLTRIREVASALETG